MDYVSPILFLVVTKGQRVTFFFCRSLHNTESYHILVSYTQAAKIASYLLHLNIFFCIQVLMLKTKQDKKKSQIRIGDECELAWIVWNVNTLAVARYTMPRKEDQGRAATKSWKDSRSRSCHAGYRLVHPQNSIIHMESIFSIKKWINQIPFKVYILHSFFFSFFIQNWTSGLTNDVYERSESTLLLFLFFLDTLGCSLTFLYLGI